MNTLLIVHAHFERAWPFAADHLVTLLQSLNEPVEVIRLALDDKRELSQIVESPERVERLILWRVPLRLSSLSQFANLKELVYEGLTGGGLKSEVQNSLQAAGIKAIVHESESMWAQSVAEFALALVLSALRRIPQLHQSVAEGRADWTYLPTGPGDRRALQFGDDPRFVNGTLRGKRLRILGLGNTGSRLARIASSLGADVAAWDPFAQEALFPACAARRERHLDKLFDDAEIVAPMLPLTEKTMGLVTAEHIYRLPVGSIVALVTRAHVCDIDAIRSRVLANELFLAADVFDEEPLQTTDVLLGRENVIHTPHIAGRTRDANEQYAALLVNQFRIKGAI
jgi:phosphoglycerate dehydrogenase-like enzyme